MKIVFVIKNLWVNNIPTFYREIKDSETPAWVIRPENATHFNTYGEAEVKLLTINSGSYQIEKYYINQ